MTGQDANQRHDLRAISERLEVARSIIEDRFIEGGAALMSAHDMVARLLESLEGIVEAFDDAAAEHAMAGFSTTMTHIGDLVVREQGRCTQLAGIRADAEAIGPLIRSMLGYLRYLATCAVATRISGAGVPEFIGFADDVTTYVASAAEQVSLFSDRVGALEAELARTCGNDQVSAFAASVPAVATTLKEATQAVRTRQSELGKLARQATTIANSIQSKVGVVLSALQIGDVTRQRIEHVQAGVALLTALLDDDGADTDACFAAGFRLLAAQTVGLITDFDDRTRSIVANIEGFAREAGHILSLTREATAGDADPMKTIEQGVAAVHLVVRDIETAGTEAAAAHAATRQVATDLLSNVGSIGNLRSVRDDIRCLAINAYLRSTRLGPKGRAVGVVASEMNIYAARLGVAAEGILTFLSAMERASSAGDGPAGVNLTGDLDAAAETLRSAITRTEQHVKAVTRDADTVADRIVRIAGELDFKAALGDVLEECRQLFSRRDSASPGWPDDPRLEAFSVQLFSVYSMASERDIHRSTLPIGLTENDSKVVKKIESIQEVEFDDVLF